MSYMRALTVLLALSLSGCGPICKALISDSASCGRPAERAEWEGWCTPACQGPETCAHEESCSGVFGLQCREIGVCKPCGSWGRDRAKAEGCPQ